MKTIYSNAYNQIQRSINVTIECYHYQLFLGRDDLASIQLDRFVKLTELSRAVYNKLNN